MRILIITRDVKDGIGSTVKNLVWQYEKRSDVEKIVIIAPGTFDVKTSKVEFWNAPMKGTYFFTREPSFAWNVRKLLKEKLPTNSFDIVHLHSNILGFSVIKKFLGIRKVISTYQGTHNALIKNINIPVISTVHSNHKATITNMKVSDLKYSIGKYGHIPFMYLDKLRIKESAVVTCVSKKTLEEVRTKDSTKRFEYLPNGVDTEVYKRIKVDSVKFFKDNFNIDVENKKLVLYIGRLESGKGVHDLAEAVKDFDDTLLIMAGEGAEASKLREYKNTKLLGYVSDINLKNQLLNAVNLFVLPSLYENFPLVIVEAMATKQAIVSTKVGMVPEILENREEALVEPGDRNGLSIKIRNMLNDDSLREKNGELNYKYVKEKLRWEDISEDYINLYKLLMPK